MSQPVKNHVSNNHDGLAILRESATPDIYRKNGFRILELPVDVGAKEINSRTRLVEMAFRQHAELNSQPNNEAQDSDPSSTPEAIVLPPGRGRYFPLTPAPDQFAIRDAVQRLSDPERRLVDEFFWFWPHSQGESAKDEALTNLREDKNKEAEGIWLEQESEQSESSVSTHNLAVLYHFMALEWENYKRNSELAEEDKNNIEKLWKRAYRRWAMLLNEEGFWSRLNARIREMEDPRLTAETASRIRRSLPAALLSISARLALHAVEEKRKESAFRLVDSIRNSGFSEADIKEGLRLAVEPVRNRIKALCKAAEDSVVADPIHADKTCRQLLDSTIPLLNGLDCLLPTGNPTRDLAHDDVAEQALKCQVAFAKKTNNWKISVELLEAAATVAASESVIKTLKENVETVKKNASNNDDFCGEGYYDLPAPVLEELEAARKHADSQDFDGAVSRLEKLASSGGSVVVEPSHLLLINKALAYCLGFRAIKRINESMAEWNAHKPSTITDIQKRADSIDQTSWMCAGMEQIPQYTNCRCMACGSMITGRYTVVKWTFKDKPVSLIICGSCGDRHRREMDSARSKINGAIKQSAQDFVDAGQLDSANKFVQGQIERVRKMCSDSEVPFPSPSKQSKKAAKQQAAASKPRTETPTSGTSVRTAECANAKKSLYWGIASIFCFLAAIPAIVLGHKALQEIKQSNGKLCGRAKARIGLVLGYIAVLGFLMAAWYLAVEQPANEAKARQAAEQKAQEQAAIQKATEDKAKADAEVARLAEEKRKVDELAAQKAAEEKAEQARKSEEAQRAWNEIQRISQQARNGEAEHVADAQMTIEQRVKLSTDSYRAKGYHSIANIVATVEGQEDAIIGRQNNGNYFKATVQVSEEVLGPDDVPQNIKDALNINVGHPLVWVINRTNAQETVKAMENKDQSQKVIEYNKNYETLLSNARLPLFGRIPNSVIVTLYDRNTPTNEFYDDDGKFAPAKFALSNLAAAANKRVAQDSQTLERQRILDSNDPVTLKTLADQDDADAALRLGLLYDAGKGVNQDFTIAVNWYRKAADAGNPDAQNNLGRMYEEGFGVRKDDSEATNWFQRAEETRESAEAARLADEKRKADELVAQKAIEGKNTQPENVNSIGQTAQNQSDAVPSSQQFITADSNTSYALGMMLANNWAKQRLKLLSDDITAGIKDVLNGNATRFNREEMKSTITAFQAQIRQRSNQSLTEADANTSYAIGMALADNWNKQQLKVQLDDLIAGTKDVINGNATRLSQTEMQTTIAAFQTQFKQQALEIRSNQARQNAKVGNAFLESNKMRPGVVTLPSGLQYEIITTGSGDRPALNDTVTVNYRGTLVDGTEFDSSYKRGQPAQFPVSGVIRGWAEALQVMNVGSKWKLFIPPDLAYGEQGRPGIPPNSVLIFEVELLSVKAQQNVTTTTQPLTSDIIKVPTADEMKRGAKIEVVQGTMTTDTTSAKTTVQIAPTTTGSTIADTSIYDAARDGDLEKVKTLLKNDPNLVFSKNSDGWTPLHFAAAFGHKDMVELLLVNKADVNAKNNGDWTPLRYSVENGHTDVAELLREHGGHE